MLAESAFGGSATFGRNSNGNETILNGPFGRLASPLMFTGFRDDDNSGCFRVILLYNFGRAPWRRSFGFSMSFNFDLCLSAELFS